MPSRPSCRASQIFCIICQNGSSCGSSEPRSKCQPAPCQPAWDSPFPRFPRVPSDVIDLSSTVTTGVLIVWPFIHLRNASPQRCLGFAHASLSNQRFVPVILPGRLHRYQISRTRRSFFVITSGLHLRPRLGSSQASHGKYDFGAEDAAWCTQSSGRFGEATFSGRSVGRFVLVSTPPGPFLTSGRLMMIRQLPAAADSILYLHEPVPFQSKSPLGQPL